MKKSFLFIVLCAVIFSCASGDKKQEQTQSEQGLSIEDTLPTARGGQLTFDPKIYVKKQYDASKDGKADIINVFKKVPKKDGARGEYDLHIHVKMMDLNRDGKIDVWRFYDDRGAVVKEEVDLDFDGKIDVVNFYVGGVIRRKEFDVRFDEKTDRWKHYDENGALILLEEDKSNNGQIDYWEYYTNGVLERIEKDTSGDSKPDVFQRTGDKGFTKIMSTTDKFDDKAQVDREFSKKPSEPQKEAVTIDEDPADLSGDQSDTQLKDTVSVPEEADDQDPEKSTD